MRALNVSAPIDLRVNPAKGRPQNRTACARRGRVLLTEPTPSSPVGLRLKEAGYPSRASRRSKMGFSDVQDEGSEIAALTAGARPGMRVVDFCAGGGGKTASAAGMANRGKLVACDVSAYRLDRAARRLRRAGVGNVERRTLSSEHDKWVKRHAGGFDRVFVDAPCLGTGTWRRKPRRQMALATQ